MKAHREGKYEKILDAAIEAISESGYHQCQVTKIARLAGVADGTIYLYFKSKEEVLIRVFQERMGDFIAFMRRELLQCETTKERLGGIIRTHFSYMEQNRSLAIFTQLELRQSDPRIRSAVRETILGYYSLIEGVIEQGIENGEVIETDVRVARHMIFGFLDEATTDWVMARSPRSIMRDFESILALLEGALRLDEKPK